MTHAQAGNYATVLLFAFIILKVLGVLTMSWLWVLAPLWLPIIYVVVRKAIEQ